MPKFVIFSTELGPALDPYDEYDDYASIVRFDRDPIVTGSYDDHAGSIMRGSVIPTLGGVVVQATPRGVELGLHLCDHVGCATRFAACKAVIVQAD